PHDQTYPTMSQKSSPKASAKKNPEKNKKLLQPRAHTATPAMTAHHRHAQGLLYRHTRVSSYRHARSFLSGRAHCHSGGNRSPESLPFVASAPAQYK
ncbi:MAG: hypothetical protein OXU98_08315, partial [Gammaproteobacteria bacterium]|nr:hypothetical protein [Gammaproteobacteria bacterium]